VPAITATACAHAAMDKHHARAASNSNTSASTIARRNDEERYVPCPFWFDIDASATLLYNFPIGVIVALITANVVSTVVSI
jgi:hypothetical protein